MVLTMVQTFSRRTAYNASILVLLICSIATAVSTNIHMFIAFRLLAAVEVTFYQVIGQTIIADVFSREVRGTAIGVWMIGPVAGPSLGALIGGVIISFTTWRVIFYVQTALVALGLVLSLLFVPSIAQTEYEEVKPSVGYWAKVQWKIVARVAAMMCTPSVLLGVRTSSESVLQMKLMGVAGYCRWSPQFRAVLVPRVASPSDQPSFPPHLTLTLRLVLSLTWCWIHSRLHGRWKILRHHHGKTDQSKKWRSCSV